MRRRVLVCLTLVSLSACNGDKVVQPTASPGSPTNVISDATHTTSGFSNPDFFFLPPMVKDPSGSPLWNAGAFNATLAPTIDVCPSTSASTAVFADPCAPSATLAAHVDVTAEHYQANWQVPVDATVFYRLVVKVGHKVLGFADVQTAANMAAIKSLSTGEYVNLVDGRTLPIKVRIERYALCDHPGTGPCASSTVDLATGGTVSTTVVTDGLPAGITIPPGAGTTSTTITVQSCPDLPLDAPLFGTCVRITADPALPPSGFAVLATVFICDVNDASVASRVVDHAQSERITIHRLDPGEEGPVITALPHAPACGVPIASTQGSLHGMLAALRRGHVGAAAREALSMLAPKPLYAARFIDLGGGGFTAALSDFQFALPSKMEIVPSSDGQAVIPGTTISPTVLVTDLGGEPVRGAAVHFLTADPATMPGTVVTTGADGLASTPWPIGLGHNALTARGRGIAAPATNGPRRTPNSVIDDIVDPFQPIQSPFDAGTTGTPLPVTVGTGSVTFAATGLVTGFESSDAAWSSSGFWHPSTLAGLSNSAYQSALVTLGANDNSGGALPAPFTGARALWFGTDAGGNYAGDLGSQTQLGGTSTFPRSGAASSPDFVVPNIGNGVNLTFRSWFEIESVNPSRYDLMDVYVQDADALTPALLARLNPATDPGGSAQTPFTSGGFNAAPVWQQVTVDLSAYKGKHVRLIFNFDTRDRLYNGFRGWVVDDVALRSVSGPSLTLVPLEASPSVVPLGDAPERTWHP